MKKIPEKYRSKIETIKRAILVRSGLLSEFGRSVTIELTNYDFQSNVIELRQKSKEEKEQLKGKTISKDELEDVLVNLSDICDADPGSKLEIKETFIRRTDGIYMYLIKFTKKDLGFNFKEIENIIGSRSYGTPRIKIDNFENLKSIIEEIDNIKYALKEGWDLDINIYIKDNTIEIEVYEVSKKI